MLNIIYDENTQLKPNWIGIYIGQQIQQKKLTGDERFISYTEITNEAGEQVCLLLVIPDSEQTHNIISISDLAVKLLIDPSIQTECKPQEGVLAIMDDDIFNKYKDDPNCKLTIVDTNMLKDYMSSCISVKNSVSLFNYDKYLQCYFTIYRVNEQNTKLLNNFSEDWLKTQVQINRQMTMLFAQQYWPDDYQNIQFEDIIYDTKKDIYDKKFNIKRRYIKYCVRFLKDGKVLELNDYDKNKVFNLNIKDYNNFTYDDIINGLNYLKNTGVLFDDDIIPIIYIPTLQKIPSILIKRRDVELTDMQKVVFNNCTLKDVFEILDNKDRNLSFDSLVVSSKFYEWIKNNIQSSEIGSTFINIPLIPSHSLFNNEQYIN